MSVSPVIRSPGAGRRNRREGSGWQWVQPPHRPSSKAPLKKCAHSEAPSGPANLNNLFMVFQATSDVKINLAIRAEKSAGLTGSTIPSTNAAIQFCYSAVNILQAELAPASLSISPRPRFQGMFGPKMHLRSTADHEHYSAAGCRCLINRESLDWPPRSPFAAFLPAPPASTLAETSPATSSFGSQKPRFVTVSIGSPPR
jgi:hypothetical protein